MTARGDVRGSRKSLFFGPVTDKLGREAMYTIDLAVLVGGSVLSVFATETWQFVVLRFVLGMAIGADYPIATSLLAEWVPNKHRGRLLGILILLMRIGTPESPLWLVNKGRTAEAQKAIQKALDRTVPVEELLAASAAEQSVEKSRFRACSRARICGARCSAGSSTCGLCPRAAAGGPGGAPPRHRVVVRPDGGAARGARWRRRTPHRGGHRVLLWLRPLVGRSHGAGVDVSQ
ncbi:hypothetical protein SSP24_76520 [Streptomyces spinoverrucosus]|uniref:Major facilitator superfamily (MFS) profile domain-containing protein n=1 Tax=Streptomyces spinoverrucosus TaxID=284043 RepID=A0A4Y3VT26_9ACTN|nr:hypothetical protein SSP24_76520 [Streptomyces spinoverrucosus]GHB51715.1 hypothetical protein GCM10010397_22530 [Streptomyces spinoverrucosus]